MTDRRKGRNHADQMQILGTFDDGDQWSAADLTCMTGLRSARVARALEALTADGWVVDGWDDYTPPRRWYMVATLVPDQGGGELLPLSLHEARRGVGLAAACAVFCARTRELRVVAGAPALRLFTGGHPSRREPDVLVPTDAQLGQ